MNIQDPSPLASLYINANDLNSLRYPSDLGSTRKGHWIRFNISVPTKSVYNKKELPAPTTPTTSTNYLALISSKNMQNLGKMGINGLTTIGNAVLHPIDTVNAAVNAAVDSVAASISNGIDSITSGTAYNAPIPQFWDYTVTPGTVKLKTVIDLYMPDTVSLAQHSFYVAESLSEASGVLGQLAAGVQGIGDLIMSESGSGGWDAIKNMGIEGAIGHATGNDTLVRAGLKAAGSAINPQMEVFFKDIDFRTFQFDFLFTPKNAQEAENVKAIIQAIKFHAAPELDINNSAGGRYYIVPSVFEIQAYKDGKPNENINKYGICACETVSVDYAPQGWVTHDDGMPVQTRLTLQFKEMEIMTKEKISQGY